MLRLGTKEDVGKLHKTYWDMDKTYYTWGNEDLDKKLPLLTDGQLVVMAGAQSAGKTHWSIEMALENARRGIGKYAVGYLALEVEMENILYRQMDRVIGVTKEDRRLGKMYKFDDIEEKKVKSRELLQSYMDSELLMFKDHENMELHLLASIDEILDQEYAPKLLFIDNLGEIMVSNDSEYERQNIIMKALHAMVRTHGATIVLLHHLAKPKGNEEPDINSIKGNNIIVTKADTTVAIFKKYIKHPLWTCPATKADGTPNKQADINKFNKCAPTVTSREIHTLKDRWYGKEGLNGYMEISKEGALEFYTERNELMDVLKSKNILEQEDLAHRDRLREEFNLI